MENYYLELLQKTLVSELAKAITDKGTECKSTAEDVFEKLPSLFEEIAEKEFGEPTDKKLRYLPKQYKEIVMRLISPTCSLQTRSEYFEDHVTSEALLYYDRNDSKPISTAKASYFFANMDETLSEQEKRSYAELSARGLAESKALQKFGIGAWFKSTFEPDENPEKAAANIADKNRLNPETVTPPVATAPITTKESKQKQENISQTEDVTEKTEEPTENDIEENSETLPFEETDNVSMTLDEAKEIPVDIGKAKDKGLNLGQTAEKFPRNILWLYINSKSEEVRTGIKVIVKNTPDLRKLFEESGITI